ncbi:MAG: bacillithiol biosynthesis cysteine-adding enzyme BshC [Crocinitomicaceae bacterium]
MLKTHYQFEDLQLSSQLILDLIAEKESVKPLINQSYNLENVRDQLKDKRISPAIRKQLVDALKRQNAQLEISQKSQENLTLLSEESTYTVTTGHQLNVLTGPLYSLYKVAQTIVIAKALKEKYPHSNFVPIFWMATEDHDFDEINHLHLFGQKIAWEKSGQEDKVVGRISTDSIDDFLEQIEEKFKDPEALKVVRVFTDIYRKTDTLAAAGRQIMDHFFGREGLLILDGDEPDLKSFFAPVMVKEVEEQLIKNQVEKTNAYLQKNGYHEQVYVRTCNLFFINEEGKRIRIRREGETFHIGDTAYTKEQLTALIREHPQQFSPNALMRPIYQEMLLPNVVVVGGGGEIAYWLQLKGVFDQLELSFPLLRVRDSVLLHTREEKELLNELKIELMDLKMGVHQIIKDIALQESESNLQLTAAESDLFKAKSKVMEKVHQVNSALEPMVEAEFTKMIKSIEKIESKLIKAEKAKHEKTQKNLLKVKEHFFPENGFQERHESFLFYYLKDELFIQKILTNLSAGNKAVIQLIEI